MCFVAQCAEELSTMRQLTSKAMDINFTREVLFKDFVMVASTVLIVKVTRLDRVLSIAIQCGPR